jgi:hypothetical protein
MAISFSKYIDITSGVGAGASVRQRDLIGRLFTTSELLPTGSMVEMTTSDDVKNYFGADSEEYRRALVYFGFVSKNIVSPKKISFASFTPDATAPKVFGGKITSNVASFESITNGSINVTMGATTNAITGIDFTGVATLSDVADAIKAAINDETGTMWTAADVTYDAVNKRFNLTGGAAGTAAMNIQAGGTGTNIATLINWIEGADPILYARFSDGAAVQTYADCASESASVNNNFGSFEFLPIQGAGLVYMPLADAVDVAVWNDSENVKFIFCLGVFYTDTSDYSDALLGYSGTALTLVEDTLTDYQYPEMIPMIVLAATDYTRRNATQNYMYQQVSGIDASVTSTSISNALDLLRVNYYGQTQTAGQKISFYQRGLMCGGSTDPVDMNTYANELWFKDACSAALMTLLLALGKVSANREGRGQIINQLLSIIDIALFNGTISIAKTLTNTQKQYIDGITGIADSWRNIFNVGYWLDVEIQSYVTQDSRTEYKAVYTICYSKDDAIKKIEGTHILI